LGGRQKYEQLKATAKRDGFAHFTTVWGQAQQLGPGWFADIEASQAATAVANYHGDLMVLYGDQDQVIAPALAHQVVVGARRARSVTEHVIAGADHGLGLFNNDVVRSELVVQKTVQFLIDRLSANSNSHRVGEQQ